MHNSIASEDSVQKPRILVLEFKKEKREFVLDSNGSTGKRPDQNLRYRKIHQDPDQANRLQSARNK